MDNLEMDDLIKLFLEIVKNALHTIIINYDKIGITELLNLNGENDLTRLKNYVNKPGVYIFLDKNDKVVYVGKALSSHGLKDRLQKQLNCDPSNANLANNIRRKENYICAETDKQCLKRCLHHYTSSIMVCETRNDRDASLLECLLIYSLQPKYNID